MQQKLTLNAAMFLPGLLTDFCRKFSPAFKKIRRRQVNTGKEVNAPRRVRMAEIFIGCDMNMNQKLDDGLRKKKCAFNEPAQIGLYSR